MQKNKTVGIALGGGGVRGLAHVLALEVIDECEIRPAALAGTSMGAIIGALYASGKSGKEIHDTVKQHIFARGDDLKDIYAKKGFLIRWLSSIRVAWKGTGLLTADTFLERLLEQMAVETFEDLEIPLRVVATDFHTGEPVIFDAGPLLPALRASMSIPGVFVPVEHEGRVLVDGGMSNNLPYDLLADDCEVTIAIDVFATRDEDESSVPSMIDATIGMFDILVNRTTRMMLEQNLPTIYICPELVGIRVLDFARAEAVFEQSGPAMADLRAKLQHYLGG